MLEPYSKARIINLTLNNRTKPFKLVAMIYWFSRLILNLLRWVTVLTLTTNTIHKIVILLIFWIWPLFLICSIVTKQIISSWKLLPNPCCTSIILIFLGKNNINS